ncbi:hypothetical protein EST38_g10487 [Candolleomyces aberdarensis]|uniref:Uncharacterized protein n=1 Tax=Candolleomyces aberdarensis TaxID=2316362 RepID=A0A4Q2D9P3_9AGAR|nr:hypothetical protein EST38_g10487 [Candolleomyces aberdarensis]
MGVLDILKGVFSYLRPQSNPGSPGRIVCPEGLIVTLAQDLDTETWEPTKPEVYIRSMLTSGKGLASWEPSPYDGERGTLPGDVGTFSAAGGFKKIFNLWEDAEDIRRKNSSENCYTPPKKNVSTRKGVLGPRGPVRDGTSADTQYTDDGKGAILVSTSPADLEELDNYIKLRDFIIDNAGLLYHCANEDQGLGHDESLYIVTGCIKSESWAMASFTEPIAPPHDIIKLVKRSGSDPVPPYVWTSQGTATTKSYPEERIHKCNRKDQTLFMHGFKLSFSPPFRSRWNNRSIPRDTDSSKPSSDSDFSYDGRGQDGQDDTHRGSSSNRGDRGGGSSGTGPRSSSGHALSGGVSIQPFPERHAQIALHPLDATNRRLLHLTSTDFALTHDDDWRFALENKTLDDVDSFDALRTSSISVCNGVAFLVHGEPQKEDLCDETDAAHVRTFNDEGSQQNAPKTASSTQSPISQPSIHPAKNKTAVERLGSTAVAVANSPEASASTPISRDPVSESSIFSARDGKIVKFPKRLGSSRFSGAPSPVEPPLISLFEGVKSNQMNIANVFNEGTQQNALEVGALPKHLDTEERALVETHSIMLKSRETKDTERKMVVKEEQKRVRKVLQSQSRSSPQAPSQGQSQSQTETSQTTQGQQRPFNAHARGKTITNRNHLSGLDATQQKEKDTNKRLDKAYKTSVSVDGTLPADMPGGFEFDFTGGTYPQPSSMFGASGVGVAGFGGGGLGTSAFWDPAPTALTPFPPPPPATSTSASGPKNGSPNTKSTPATTDTPGVANNSLVRRPPPTYRLATQSPEWFIACPRPMPAWNPVAVFMSEAENSEDDYDGSGGSASQRGGGRERYGEYEREQDYEYDDGNGNCTGGGGGGGGGWGRLLESGAIQGAQQEFGDGEDYARQQQQQQQRYNESYESSLGGGGAGYAGSAYVAPVRTATSSRQSSAQTAKARRALAAAALEKMARTRKAKEETSNKASLAALAKGVAKAASRPVGGKKHRTKEQKLAAAQAAAEEEEEEEMEEKEMKEREQQSNVTMVNEVNVGKKSSKLKRFVTIEEVSDDEAYGALEGSLPLESRYLLEESGLSSEETESSSSVQQPQPSVPPTIFNILSAYGQQQQHRQQQSSRWSGFGGDGGLFGGGGGHHSRTGSLSQRRQPQWSYNYNTGAASSSASSSPVLTPSTVPTFLSGDIPPISDEEFLPVVKELKMNEDLHMAATKQLKMGNGALGGKISTVADSDSGFESDWDAIVKAKRPRWNTVSSTAAPGAGRPASSATAGSRTVGSGAAGMRSAFESKSNLAPVLSNSATGGKGGGGVGASMVPMSSSGSSSEADGSGMFGTGGFSG